MQGGGPNDTSFGPQIHFFLFVYPLTVSSLIRVYTNDTHRRELLLAGWILPRPPTTMATTTWCRHRRQLLYLKRQHCREQLLAGWIPILSMTTTWCCRRQLLYSKGLTIAGPPRCRSYTRELLHSIPLL